MLEIGNACGCGSFRLHLSSLKRPDKRPSFAESASVVPAVMIDAIRGDYRAGTIRSRLALHKDGAGALLFETVRQLHANGLRS
jgi:hypothetical protein